MNRLVTNTLIVIFLLAVFWSRAQENIHLFPDRSSCLSGDTVWFNAFLFSGEKNQSGSVIHVQLDHLQGNHITKTSVSCPGSSAPGFLHVPDSLSTGVYVLKAFSNAQKGNPTTIVNQRYLLVYNRFDEDIYSILMPASTKTNFLAAGGINMRAEPKSGDTKELYVELSADQQIYDNLAEMIITARLADPLAEEFASFYSESKILENEAFMPLEEKNGVIISGRVVSNETGKAIDSTPVLLSIPDTFPYFDYCITDERGSFFFYVRNAIGRGAIVLQEAAANAPEKQIELFENYINTPAVRANSEILTLKQKNFAEKLVKASYFARLFRNYQGLSADFFSLKPEFKYPFYGKPTRSFYPGLFIDLPDFQEISREILHGVQYRDRRGDISIRMLNNGDKSVFQTEPLKLLDGIPVFDHKVFSKLQTSDIAKVDAVFFKRYFGDLSFNGVMAVYSNKPSLGWVESRPEMHVFNYNFIQPPTSWNFVNTKSRANNLPDFNYVLYRKRLKEMNGIHNFSFAIPDIKGEILIEVIAVSKDRTIVRHAEIINTEN